MILVIDGDILAFQIASSAEVATHWGDDFWTLHADAREAKDRLDDAIEKLRQDLEADGVVLCLSDRKRNFRKEIYPAYKSNRANKRKPMVLLELRKHLIEEYQTWVEPRLEADDLLGILMTSPDLIPDEKILVSIDKDLKSVSGRHFQTNRPEQGIFEVTPEEANWWHMMQTLTGDPVDGFQGCPNVGLKTAERILAEAPSRTYADMWPLVVETFQRKGLSEEEALLSARVAYILRDGDYDFEKGEIRLWTPERQ